MPGFILLFAVLFTSISQAMCPQILGDFRSQIYDSRVIQLADQNAISLLNLHHTDTLELRAELQKLVEQLNLPNSPLVGILDSEQVLVKGQIQDGVQFIFISLGLLKFAKDDRELQQIVKYELTHPQDQQKSIAEKYQPFLAGLVEVKPILERAYDVKEDTGPTDVVSLAKKITYTPEYMQLRDEKFDRLMSVDLTNTRTVIDPLYTGGPLPSPSATYFMHSQFENYYEIFKAHYPPDKTPAETLRYFEIRLQMLIRAQMIQLVEEVLDARTKAQLPLNREEILILHHMLGKMWMLRTESTSMMRLGHSSWVISWAYEKSKIDVELAQLTEQHNEVTNLKHKDVIDTQIQDLINRKKILQIKMANLLVFYDLDDDTFMKLQQITKYPDRVPQHLPQWEPVFNQKIRGLGPLLQRAQELIQRIDSEFAYGGMLRDLRTKPDDAFWLLRSADKMEVDEQIEINKKAFDILLEMKAVDSLRTLIRSDHDAVMVKWFQKNQAEAQDYVMRVFVELAKDENFDANRSEIHRGTFIKEYVSSNKYLEKYLNSLRDGKNYAGHILTPQMLVALGELSQANPTREFAKKPNAFQQVLADENLNEKQRNEKLFELVVYKNHLNEFYPAIFEYLELPTQVPDAARELVERVEMAAIESYSAIFKIAGIENSQIAAETFLFLATRQFGQLTNRTRPSVKQIEQLMKDFSALSFMSGRYGFVKIGNLINLCRKLPKKDMLAIVDVVHPYLDNGYNEALPEGMSADRYFNEKYQIAQHLLKKEKPNFNTINRVMADARAGSDVNAYPLQEKIARSLQKTIIKAQFEFHWNKYPELSINDRIQQSLQDYMADCDILIWNYGFKEGYLELAAALTSNDTDRKYFIAQVIVQLTANNNKPRNHDELIKSFQMLLKLNL